VRAASPSFLSLGFLARLPYATTPLATLILVEHATRSYAFAGLVGTAQGIAIAGGAPLVGTLADRWGHRRVGLVVALVNAASVAGLVAATTADLAMVVVAATLTGLTQPLVGPLVRVHWGRLLRGGDRPRLLPAALSYETVADEASFIAGPVFVGLLTPLAPAAPAIGTVILLAGVTAPFALHYEGGRVARPRRSETAVTGLALRPLAGLFVAMAAIGMVFGAVQTGVTAYADAIDEPSAAGLVYAELAIGSALAGASCVLLPARFGLHRRYVTFAAALLAGMIVLATGGSLLPVPVAVLIASLPIAPYMIAVYELTTRLGAPARAATVMTIVCAGGPLGTAVARAIAGVLADGHGTAGAFSIAPAAGGIALMAALAVVVADRRPAGGPDR
jgi:MFS family permease